MEICDRELCTGCQTCVQICPTHAITMHMDKDGFYYPEINTSLCKNCDLCHKKCVANNPPNGNTPFQVFACWNKNKADRRKSASGGVFYALAQQVILNGGVVFGAAWIETGVQHIKCDNLDDLKKLQGSKYLQSNIGNSYLSAKQLLASGHTVLFSGTPCQIAALRLFLGKEYEKLYTVDVVCHGVPSERVLQSYKEELEEKYNDSIGQIRFRVKHPNWLFSAMGYRLSSGIVRLHPLWKDPFFLGFVNNFYLRPSCYRCSFSRPQRNGDLTLCDFWGFRAMHLKMFGHMDGVSAVMINTSSGVKLFELIEGMIKYEKHSLQEVMAGNRNLHAPQQRPENADQFWSEYQKNSSISYLSQKYFPESKRPNYSYKSRFRTFIRLILLEMSYLLKGNE